MRRPTLLLILFVGLLVIFALSGFGSSAQNNKPDNLAGESSSQPNQADRDQDKDRAAGSPLQREEDEEEEADADMGKFHGKLDHDKYLRLRDEFIGLKRGMEPGRLLDPRMRGRAIEQMQSQEGQASGKATFFGRVASFFGFDVSAGPAWTELGPAPLPNGQVSGGGPVSGRVTSVVVDPTNPNIVYVGAAQGGVWRSLDGGTTWASIFDNAQSLAVGALALAPSNHSILYVGTGEFNSCSACFFGAGLYRIDNADTTATLVGPINPSQTIGNLTYSVFNGRSISKILVHPTNSDIIFVATASGVGGSGGNALSNTVPPLGTRGVYRSTNATAAAGSVTFQKLAVTIDNSFDNPPTGNVSISDMVMDPGNSNNLVVATIGQTAGMGGIYRSTNALSGTPTFSQTLPLTNGTRVNLAINNTAGNVTVYAATSETPSNTLGCTVTNSGAIRKSTDGGATWPAAQLTGGGGFCSGQCFYDMPIAVDPNNADNVYIGGQISSTCGRLVGKSTNGGDSFASDGVGLHADSHAFFFDTAGNIYAGNDGGIWKRSASAAAGTAWTNLNHAPLNTLQFESVAVHPFDQFMTIGGTQDNGTEYQINSNGNWRGAESGDGGYALIDQSATDTTNVVMYHTFYNIKGDQVGFDRSVNTTCLPNKDFWPTRGIGFLSGADAEQLSLSCDGTANYLHNGLSLTDDVLFYAPMALGPGSPNTLYFGTDRLYRSTDRGDHMTVVSQGPIANGVPISSIAISPQDDNYRIVGLRDGQVWATSTNSSTLVNLNFPAPANPNGSLTNRFVGRVMIDPNNKNVAYVALAYFATAGQGLWKISNLGAAAGSSPAAPNWTVVANGIPSIPINSFAIDPNNSNNLFAGTDIGVYNSTDGGANWAPYGTGLPRVAVFDMKIQNTSRLLRVATHGRGMWEISIGSTATPTPTPTPITYSVSGHVADAGNNPVSGVTMLFEMNFQGTVTTKSVLTDANGNFNSGDVGCQNNVKVTPSKTGYAFSPLSLSFVSTQCLTGSGTANFTASLLGPTIFVEEGTANQAVALDSVTLVRGPFKILTTNNFSADHHTRVILFTSDLGLNQFQPNLSVLNVKAGTTQLPVENVGTLSVAGLVASSYIVVRLPDGLPPGNLALVVTLNGVASTNSPTLAISP